MAIPEQAWEGVVVDKLTKFAHFISFTYPFSALEVAKMFMVSLVRIHEVTKSIVSDRDKIFTSVFWQELFKSLGVRLHMSTTYHPQTYSQTKSQPMFGGLFEMYVLACPSLNLRVGIGGYH